MSCPFPPLLSLALHCPYGSCHPCYSHLMNSFLTHTCPACPRVLSHSESEPSPIQAEVLLGLHLVCMESPPRDAAAWQQRASQETPGKGGQHSPRYAEVVTGYILCPTQDYGQRSVTVSFPGTLQLVLGQ